MGLKIIVSMTTTAHRVKFLNHTLKSLLAQTISPDSIELNIPYKYERADLDPVDIDAVPYGFSVYRCKDYGPATKLLPTLQRYKDKDVIIIYCDDDRTYDPSWIERLLIVHEKHGKCCVADEMFDIPYYINQERIKKTPLYRLKRVFTLGLWQPRKVNYAQSVIVEGFGGVLVRPYFFDQTVFAVPKQFFPVDDIWFSAKLAERKIPIKFSGRRLSEKSQPVIINNLDVGRAAGSLTTTLFDGDSRRTLDLTAMIYAINQLGVWKEWSSYLENSK